MMQPCHPVGPTFMRQMPHMPQMPQMPQMPYSPYPFPSSYPFFGGTGGRSSLPSLTLNVSEIWCLYED